MVYAGFFLAGVVIGATLVTVYALVVAAKDLERMRDE